MKTTMRLNIILLLLFFSCKKIDSGDTGSHWAVPKIKTIKYDGNMITSFFYDQEGRIIKGEDGYLRVEYSYEPLKVIAKTTEIASGGTEKDSLELNAEGYVSKIGNANYAYTPEGYVKSIVKINTNGPAGFQIYYHDSSTKLVDSVVRLKGSTWQQTTVYEYYENKKETTGSENYGQAFYGRSMPHPVKSVTYWGPKQASPDREILRTEKYEYLYDEADRIVRKNASTNTMGQHSSSSAIYNYY